MVYFSFTLPSDPQSSRSIGAGKQGFQSSIPDDSFVVDGIGALGNVHEERGLTYYEVVLSGHMYV